MIMGKFWAAFRAQVNKLANFFWTADPIAQMQYEYDRAVAQLKESAAKLPEDAAIQFHLGMASVKTGDTTAAKAALKRAVESKQSVPEKALAQQALAALK